jgi:Arc/MetJ-type ribon-helix-helix transcriptional regulator
VRVQIAARLADEPVEFIDRLVSDGRAPSRAAVVSPALQRERRREIAASDRSTLVAARTRMVSWMRSRGTQHGFHWMISTATTRAGSPTTPTDLGRSAELRPP